MEAETYRHLLNMNFQNRKKRDVFGTYVLNNESEMPMNLDEQKLCETLRLPQQSSALKLNQFVLRCDHYGFPKQFLVNESSVFAIV
ncbi:hypothetical protein Nos7107_2418 [Nostoc sp. PCC 7107]|nr:hypothetical protein Nos7107_2418 [Nostoc sp. PCC 7107]